MRSGNEARKASDVNRRLRVAYPVIGVEVGGSAVSTAEMLRRLCADGRVDPVIVTPGEGPSTRLFRAAGVEPRLYRPVSRDRGRLVTSTSTWSGRARAIPVYLTVYREACKAVVDERIDIVHINEDRAMLPWALAARRVGVPLIWHVRQERANRWLDGLRLSLADQLIFVAEANRVRFAGRRQPPSITLPNVVDLTRFVPTADRREAKQALGLHPDRLTVTFVGNLVERKRPTWVLRAAAELQRNRRLQVLLVGAPLGPQRYVETLRALAARTPEPKHVHLLGARNDVPAILAASDVLTLPSVRHGEAFPRSVIEALAAGVCVVATDVAGVREAVRHGVDGLLVDPDDETGYRQALARVLDDDAERECMARAAAPGAAARFGGETMAQTLVELYQSLWTERRRVELHS